MKRKVTTDWIDDFVRATDALEDDVPATGRPQGRFIREVRISTAFVGKTLKVEAPIGKPQGQPAKIVSTRDASGAAATKWRLDAW